MDGIVNRVQKRRRRLLGEILRPRRVRQSSRHNPALPLQTTIKPCQPQFPSPIPKPPHTPRNAKHYPEFEPKMGGLHRKKGNAHKRKQRLYSGRQPGGFAGEFQLLGAEECTRGGFGGRGELAGERHSWAHSRGGGQSSHGRHRGTKTSGLAEKPTTQREEENPLRGARGGERGLVAKRMHGRRCKPTQSRK